MSSVILIYQSVDGGSPLFVQVVIFPSPYDILMRPLQPRNKRHGSSHDHVAWCSFFRAASSRNAPSEPASEGSAVLATVRVIHVPTAVYSSFNMCLLITTCLHFSPPRLVIGYSALPTPKRVSGLARPGDDWQQDLMPWCRLQ